MSNTIFEAFMERIVESILAGERELKSFKKEYNEILNQLDTQSHSLEAKLRTLGRFKIELIDFMNYLFEEKKAVGSTYVS